MNKELLHRILMVSIICGGFLVLKAQSLPGVMATSTTHSKAPSPEIVSRSNAAQFRPNNRIEKRFKILFPQHAQETWTQTADHYWVSFVQHNQTIRACFSYNGILKYSLKNCAAHQLPTNIRQYVQTMYPGYAYFHSMEILTLGKKQYQVILENEQEFITLSSSIAGIETTKPVKKTF